MQISCERCATTYLLDDKLIPPGGAPVQCTRCGLVFTAYPGRPQVPVAPRPQAAPTAARREPPPERKGTKVFGQASQGPSTPPQGTQIFGSSQADARRAQVSKFGRGAPGAPSADSTLLAGAGEVAGAPEPSRRTQMFGAVDPGEPGEGEVDASSKTVIFGAPAAPPSDAPRTPGRTMVFGAVAPRPADEAHVPGRTRAFGVIAPQGAEDAQASSRTMVFGAPSARAAAPAPAKRPEPAPADAPPGDEEGPDSSKTMVFGAPRPEPAPADAPPGDEEGPDSSKTMVFGAPRPEPAPADAPPGDEEGPGSSKTMVFGARRPEAGEAPLGDEEGPGSSKTMVFGARRPEAGEAPLGDEEGRGSSKTMVFGAPRPASPLPPEVELGGEGEPERGDRKLVFGKAKAAPAAASREARSTQMFGAPRVEAEPAADAPPPSVEVAVLADESALSSEMEAVPLPAPPEEAAPASPEKATAAELEEPRDRPSQTPLETELVSGPDDSFGEPGAGEPRATSAQGIEPAPKARPADLIEPGPAAPGEDLEADAIAEGPAASAAVPKRPPPRVGSQTMQLQLALKKSQRRLPLIFAGVAVALALAVAVGWFVVQRQRKADPALVAADGAALSVMKRDDTTSIKQAIAAWQTLEAKAPKFLPPQANQLMAYALLTADLGEEIRRLSVQAGAAQREMKRLEERREAPDYAAKAAEKREELVRLSAQMEGLQEEARASDTKAGELLTRSKQLAAGGPDGAAVFRASAVYYGLKLSEMAEKLAEGYRRGKDERGVLHDDERAFADLAIAALYARPRLPPEARAKGIAAARSALEKDPTLIRAKLLHAKMLIAGRDYPAARKVVGEIVAANPAHLAAARLIYDIEYAESHPEAAPQ